MEDFIEGDVPNGAMAGEGLFSGIFFLYFLSELDFPLLPSFFYNYYHKSFSLFFILLRSSVRRETSQHFLVLKYVSYTGGLNT